MQTVTTHHEFEEKTNNNQGVIFYFSHDECSVCKVLLPKINEMVEEHFPYMQLCYCNIKLSPELAAQNRIFAVPSILVYFEEKPYFQFSRNLSISELKNAITRPYQMIFG
ncbi:thioredoxin family protein [Plebeiibacterium marinum]|uniref:Thioredoxin family protein n=1 Tax=Plebeiibacterium marinum TaxID=2992111 RepID=A0AAE3MAS7_9BACT|nr:thioredoxin family protein [Plebeiobacterium marinum]MCW3804214.1 thioredoxin family protein [Plebeiobacterium marinum]